MQGRDDDLLEAQRRLGINSLMPAGQVLVLEEKIRRLEEERKLGIVMDVIKENEEIK